VSTEAKEIGNCSVFSGMCFPFIYVHAGERSVRLWIKVYKKRLVTLLAAKRRKIRSDSGFADSAFEVYARDNDVSHS